MRISTLLTAAALAAIVAAPALAQAPAGGGSALLPDFATMDANKDGKVTQEELTASLPEANRPRGETIFTRIDSNKDGSISKEEREAAPPLGGGRGGGGGGAPAAPK